MKPAFAYKTRHSRAASLGSSTARPASRAPGYGLTIDERQVPTPADKSWDAWFAAEPATADFLNDRGQPVESVRYRTEPRRQSIL